MTALSRPQALRAVAVVALVVVQACWLVGAAGSGPINVAVSVLPEKYFVDRIGASRVTTVVMVGPGQSPATYEPTPRQMSALSRARVYFRIGVPFELVWMERMRAANPAMRIVDVAQGIRRRSIAAGGDGGRGFPDPHVWTSPPLAKQLSACIRDTLVDLDPTRRALYQRNYAKLALDLDALDTEIRRRLRTLEPRALMTFHPSWGYFADTYGLKQIAIESAGKEPGPRTLEHLIAQAKALGIRVIFVQPQFSRRSAEAVAHAIGARIVVIDPLAEDYIDNMRRVVDALTERPEQR